MNKPKGKARRCTGKSKIGFDIIRCKKWLLHTEKKLCLDCILNKFGLINRLYDLEDGECMSPMYNEDDVIMALRKASKL